MERKTQQQKLPCDDDYVVFIPDRDFHALNRTLQNLKQTQQTFHEIRDSMKPLERGK
jgi:hypothetical protein